MSGKAGKSYDPDRLTERQRRFVQEYLADPELNAARAAIAAGYSKKNADVSGNKLLKSPTVKAALAKAASERAARFDVKADDVLRELLRIARSDVRKAFSPNNRLLPITELPDDIALAISGVDNEEMRADGSIVGDVRKVKLWDKVKALELLGKYLKLFIDKTELSGVDGGPIRVIEVNESGE